LARSIPTWRPGWSLAIVDKGTPPPDYEAAEVRISLAELYSRQARNSEAEALYEQAVPILERTRGPEHPGVAASLYRLAELYRQDQRYGKAEPLYRRSLAILEREQPADSPALARGLKTFASMLRRMKRKTEALALEARAKAIVQGQALVASSDH